MNFYKTTRQAGCELCHPVNQSDFEAIVRQVNGVSRMDKWRPILMKLISEDEGKQLIEADAPWLGSHALLFKRNAIARIGAFLSKNGELLPMECKEAEIQVFNPTHVVNALDEAASDVERYRSGRILMINKYVFKMIVIHDVDIFKIPEIRNSPTFVSQNFVELWKSSGLRGLDFIQCEAK